MKFSHKYIIVGAGSAGCILANKLSENPENSVLLIEAGPMDNYSSIKMPLAASTLFKNKKYGWGYETEPEKNLNNRTINWPRGKLWGAVVLSMEWSTSEGKLRIMKNGKEQETRAGVIVI